MAKFICADQINWDYFTVDDNWQIIPKVYPTGNKSVLWDEAWSVPTVINVNTPIIENVSLTDTKFKTDWTSIIYPFIEEYRGLWQYNVNDLSDKRNTITIPNVGNGNILTITPSAIPVVWFNYYTRDFAQQNSSSFDAPFPAPAWKKRIAHIILKWEHWINATDNTVDVMVRIVAYLWINWVFNIFWKWRETDLYTFLANAGNNGLALQPEFNVYAEMQDTGNVISAQHSIYSQYNNLWVWAWLFNSFNYYFGYVKWFLVRS